MPNHLNRPATRIAALTARVARVFGGRPRCARIVAKSLESQACSAVAQVVLPAPSPPANATIFPPPAMYLCEGGLASTPPRVRMRPPRVTSRNARGARRACGRRRRCKACLTSARRQAGKPGRSAWRHASKQEPSIQGRCRSRSSRRRFRSLCPSSCASSGWTSRSHRGSPGTSASRSENRATVRSTSRTSSSSAAGVWNTPFWTAESRRGCSMGRTYVVTHGRPTTRR